MKKIVLIILILSSPQTFAGGWTAEAVPTKLEVVRGNGFMVWGNFGNPADCSVANTIWVSIEHPQYSQL